MTPQPRNCLTPIHDKGALTVAGAAGLAHTSQTKREPFRILPRSRKGLSPEKVILAPNLNRHFLLSQAPLYKELGFLPALSFVSEATSQRVCSEGDER